MRTACLLAAVLAAPAGAERIVSKCPSRSVPARSADGGSPWICVLADAKGIDCPSGSHAATTTDVFEPFRCRLEGVVLSPPRLLCPPGEQAVPSSAPDKEVECRKADGFLSGPGCPKGSRPVPTPGQLHPFRCFADEKPEERAPAAKPDFPAKKRMKEAPARRAERCPKGAIRIRTEDPFAPVQCAPAPTGEVRLERFRRFRVPSEVAFDYPEGWHLTDAWNDELPSAYVLYSPREGGMPVSLTVTRQRHGSKSYQEMSEAMAQEKRWRNASETARGKIAGFETTFVGVPGESDTAYVDTADGYFVLSFSAPAEYYDAYFPAFQRLIQSLRVREGARD